MHGGPSASQKVGWEDCGELGQKSKPSWDVLARLDWGFSRSSWEQRKGAHSQPRNPGWDVGQLTALTLHCAQERGLSWAGCWEATFGAGGTYPAVYEHMYTHSSPSG